MPEFNIMSKASVDLDQCEWITLSLTHSTADNLQLLSPPLELTLSGGLARAQRRGGAGGPGRALLQAAADLQNILLRRQCYKL